MDQAELADLQLPLKFVAQIEHWMLYQEFKEDSRSRDFENG